MGNANQSAHLKYLTIQFVSIGLLIVIFEFQHYIYEWRPGEGLLLLTIGVSPAPTQVSLPRSGHTPHKKTPKNMKYHILKSVILLLQHAEAQLTLYSCFNHSL